MKFYLFLVAFLATGVELLAQVVPVASPSPAAPAASIAVPVAVGVMVVIAAWIKAHLIIVSGSAAATVVEFVVRLIPSDKPRSLFIIASAGFHAAGDLFLSVSSALDSLVQNIKPKDGNTPSSS